MDVISKDNSDFLTKNGIKVIGDDKFICSLCYCPVSGLKTVKFHIEGYLHQRILLYKEKIPTTERQNTNTTEVRNNGDFLTNNAHSSREMPTSQNIVANQKEKPTKLESNHSPARKEQNLFVCTMCDIECNSKVQLIHHYKGMMHHSNVAAKKSIAKQKVIQQKNLNSQPKNTSLLVEPANRTNQTVPLLKPEIQPEPINQKKKNKKNKKITKSEEPNSSVQNVMNKVQNEVKDEEKVVSKVTKSKESPKQPSQIQNGAKNQNNSSLPKLMNQITKNNQNGNLNSQPENTSLFVEPANRKNQTVPLLKPEIQPQPINQKKENKKNGKVTKSEEPNSSAINPITKAQNPVEGQEKVLKVVKSKDSPKQSSQIQNEAKKQGNQNGNADNQPEKIPSVESTNRANQTVPLLKPLIQAQPQPINHQKQLSQIQNGISELKLGNHLLKQEDGTSKKSENLIFLYDILFLSSGNLNIFHSIEVQKLMESINVTFVRNNMINCVICATSMANCAKRLHDHVRSLEHEQNMQFILENHEQFVEFPDQFSDFSLAKELMCEVSEDEIDCFVCVTKLRNDDAEIFRHVKTAKHATTRAKMHQAIMNVGQSLVSGDDVQGNWYNIENYGCEICAKTFFSEIKFFNHITSLSHKNKFETKAKCYFNFCVPCSYLCFGEEHFKYKHSKSHRHEFYLRTEKYVVPEMPSKARKVLGNVEGFVKTIVKFIDQEDLDIVKLILSDLCEISHMNGDILASEIELLQVPGCLNYTLITKDKGSFEENSKLIDTLCETRVWQKWDSENETQSVTLFNTKYAFKCRIIFDSTLLVATRYLWCYLNIYTSCKPVILFLQNWLTFCNLDSNQISFFALAWFVIFYYQNVHNYPSLQEVIFPSNCSSSKNSKTDFNSSENSVSKDLKGFFEFYSIFDFKTLMLSPFMGKAFKKRDYFSSLQTEVWKFVLAVPVVLENPAAQGINLNVTQNMTKLTLRSFRHYCAESIKLVK